MPPVPLIKNTRASTFFVVLRMWRNWVAGGYRPKSQTLPLRFTHGCPQADLHEVFIYLTILIIIMVSVN